MIVAIVSRLSRRMRARVHGRPISHVVFSMPHNFNDLFFFLSILTAANFSLSLSLSLSASVKARRHHQPAFNEEILVGRKKNDNPKKPKPYYYIIPHPLHLKNQFLSHKHALSLALTHASVSLYIALAFPSICRHLRCRLRQINQRLTRRSFRLILTFYFFRVSLVFFIFRTRMRMCACMRNSSTRGKIRHIRS